MFKKLFILLICFLLFGCGQPKKIEDKIYGTYGLLNSNTKKNPNIYYEICIGNVVWSIILFETVVFPVYFLGFSLYNPIDLKSKYSCLENGIIEESSLSIK